MLGDLYRLFGHVSLKQTDTHLIFSGIPGETITKGIAQIWSTSIINKWMFTNIGSGSFTIPKFFALEIHYILKTLLAQYKVSYISRQSIQKILTLLETETWLASTFHEPTEKLLDYSVLNDYKNTPLDHQHSFFKAFEESVLRWGFEGYVTASPPGTGKTYMMMALGDMLHADLHLGIVPKNALRTVWGATFDSQKGVKAYLSDTGKLPDISQKYQVYHYEAIKLAIDMAKKWRAANPTARAYIYVDESHNLNEIDSLRTQLLVDLVNILRIPTVKHSCLIVRGSGTPIKAVGAETIPLFKTIDALFTADVEYRFMKIYGKSATRGFDILNHRLGKAMFIIPKTVVREKPAPATILKTPMPNGDYYTLTAVRSRMEEYFDVRYKYYTERMPEIVSRWNGYLTYHASTLRTPVQKEAYEKYLKYLKVIKSGYDPINMKVEAVYCNTYEKNILIPSLPTKSERDDCKKIKSIIKYIELTIMGEVLGNVLGKARVDCHTELVDHVDFKQIIDDSEKKTLIFSSYVQVVAHLQTKFKKEGYDPRVVYGDTNSQLTSIVDDFFNVDSVNPLCATFKSLSTAVPLIAANSVVLTNSPFRDYEYDQAVSRIDRIGQDAPVRIYEVYLDTGNESNISTRSRDIMAWSREQVSAMLGQDVGDDMLVETLTSGFVNKQYSALGGILSKVKSIFGVAKSDLPF